MERAIRKSGMDLSQIYSKTSKGIIEGNSRSLTREHGRVLSLVDGKSTVGEILEKSKRLSQNRLAAVLDELAAAGLVRAAKASTIASQDDLGFSSTIIVDEANTQAFFDAQAAMERQMGRQDAQRKQEVEAERATLLADVKADIEAEAAAIKREEEQRKVMADKQAHQEAQRKETEARARAEGEAAERARQEKEKQEKERKAAEESARQETRRKEAEAKARAEAEAKLKAAEAARLKAEQDEAEALAKAKAEQQAREEAERKAQAEAEARRAAEQKAKQAEADAKARAKAEAEAAARREAEVRAQAEQEAVARAEMQAKLTAMEEAQRKAEEQADAMARQLEEARIATELEARAKRRLEARAKEEAEARERAEVEARAKLEQEARLRAEAEARAQQEAEARRQAELASEARLEEERKARVEAERKAQAEAEAKTRAEDERRRAEQAAAEQAEKVRREAEAEAQAKLEAERQAHAEAEARAKSEAEARERAAAEARMKQEQEAAERAEAERLAREEAVRQATLEGERIAREEEAVRQAELEVKLESERVARELAEAEAREAREREEARRLAREEAEAQARAEAEEAQRRVEEELRREQAEEQRLREEAEVRAKAAAEHAAVLVLPRRRFDRKWLKYAAGGIALALVAIVGLAHLLSFNFYLPTLEAQLARSLGHRVTVQDLHFSAFPAPHWRMDGVVIGNAREVRALRIDLTPALGSWFGEARQVRRVELESVTLTPQSLDLLDRWRQAQTSATAFNFGTVNVRNAKLAIPDLELFPFNADIEQAKGRIGKVHIVSADQRVTIDFTPQGESIQVKISATRSMLPFAPRIEFDRFKLSGVLRPGALTASEIEGELYGGSLNGAGELSWGEKWKLNAELSAKQISLEPALKALSREIRMTGLLETKARLAATSDKFGELLEMPQAQATFRAKQGEISNFDLVGALHAGNRAAGITGGKTQFNELSGYLRLADGRYDYQQVKMNLGVVSATGNVIFNDDRSLGGNLLAELRSRATTMRVPLAVRGHAGAPILKAVSSNQIRRAVDDAKAAPAAEAATPEN